MSKTIEQKKQESNQDMFKRIKSLSALKKAYRPMARHPDATTAGLKVKDKEI